MTLLQTDLLESERGSPLFGSPLVLVDPSEQQLSPCSLSGAVRLAVDRAGVLPALNPALFDALITVQPEAPAPWVTVPADRLDARIAVAVRTAQQAPIALAMLARLLRLQDGLDFASALDAESLAYSCLLGGGEFARWRGDGALRSSGPQAAAPVLYERCGDAVNLVLASPENRNAMTGAMRDGLYEALVNVLEDPSRPAVTLEARGKCFSTGGDLAEFGTARDLARAHVIRTQRSCAMLLHLLGDRAQVRLHGACIGSGIEIPAAASRITGAGDLIVQLPELQMGLIPGAGGTVTLARRIGRQRLLWLCLGGFRLGARQALDWGLIDVIEP
jgi:enoyl-CoA hydratase/carnithine racemase